MYDIYMCINNAIYYYFNIYNIDTPWNIEIKRVRVLMLKYVKNVYFSANGIGTVNFNMRRLTFFLCIKAFEQNRSDNNFSRIYFIY